MILSKSLFFLSKNLKQLFLEKLVCILKSAANNPIVVYSATMTADATF